MRCGLALVLIVFGCNSGLTLERSSFACKSPDNCRNALPGDSASADAVPADVDPSDATPVDGGLDPADVVVGRREAGQPDVAPGDSTTRNDGAGAFGDAAQTDAKATAGDADLPDVATLDATAAADAGPDAGRLLDAQSPTDSGLGSAIDVAPTAVDFGDVHVFRSAGMWISRELALTNLGSVDLIVSVASLSGSADFSFAPAALPPIAPGASVRVDILYMPLAVGADLAVLRLDSNDPARPRIDVSLAGNAIDPTVFVFKSTSPPLPVSPIDFGSQSAGTTSPPVTVTVQNTGFGALVINRIETVAGSSRDFILQALPALPAVVATGTTSVAFSVLYGPGTAGADTATIELESNDRDNSLVTIALLGEGTVSPDAGVPVDSGIGLDAGGGCPVGAPAPVHPPDGAEWLGGPRMGWTSLGGPITYTLSIDTVRSLDGPGLITGQTTGTTLHAINDLNVPLTAGTTYFWKVSGSNATCTGPDSSIRSFRVAMLYSRAACTGPTESPTVALIGGGLFGRSYAAQLELVTAGPLVDKIIVPISDTDGVSAFNSRVGCFESQGLSPCTNGPGAMFGAALATDFNTNVPGAAVDPSGRIFVTASNGVQRNLYVFDSAGTSTRTVPLGNFLRGIGYDPSGGAPQLLATENGATSVHSLTTNGAVNWTATTSSITNIDIEADAATNRIFVSTAGGGVRVLSHSGPMGPAPTQLFTITSLPPQLAFVDPSGLTGYVGPASNRRFIALSDGADPSAIVFLYVGTDPSSADSYPVLRLTDATVPLRYGLGLDADPVTGDVFVVTHPGGSSLRFTSFKIVRFCPAT